MTASEKSVRRPAATATGAGAAAELSDGSVIELVDVVEEGKNTATQTHKKTK
jgi:hypothetical protein